MTLILILLLTLACARTPPPSYVCIAGTAMLTDQSIQQVLICQPVSPGLIEAGP